jgi:mRNA-degrading endonuclease HigB of HigAB toxin-antitoxin module
MELYGMNLNDNMRNSISVLQSLPIEEVMKYRQAEDNYAEAMRQHSPNSREYQIYNGLRIQKLLDDPVTYRDYLINDYTLSPTQVNSIVERKLAEETNSMLEQFKMQYEDTEMELKLTKLQNDVEKGYWDAVQSQLRAINLPTQQQAELDNIVARTQNANASSELTQARINDLTKGQSAGVKDAFIDFVNHGGSIAEWLVKGNEERVTGDDGFEYTTTVKNVEYYTPEDIKELAKIAKSAGFMNTESYMEQYFKMLVDEG